MTLTCYLIEDDIYKKNIIPYHRNGDCTQLEGYLILLSCDEEKVSHISRIDDGAEAVFFRQRWLVEFAAPEAIKTTLTDHMRFTQKSLQGKKTHRYISYKVADSWDEFILKFGMEDELRFYDRGNERPIDDHTIIF